MIAFVRGNVAAIGPQTVVVDVGGIGLQLACTPGTIAGMRVGEQATVPASLIVREDSLTLFGFADEDERAAFDTLQSVSGVGPRLAQAVLGVLSPEELRRAIAVDDLATLTRVPGIGRKGAQRIALELKDRLAPPVGTADIGTTTRPPVAAGWAPVVNQALLGLGWTAKDADAAIAAVAEQAAQAGGDDPAGQPDPAVMLKLALRTLDRA